MSEISTSVNKEQAKKLHKYLVHIVKEIKRICDKHKIKYFLVYGTLLGAVRHQGMIPWDDDLDIGMLREDYDKFVKVCSEELKKPFVLCNAHTEKYYGLPFSKVRLDGTVFLEDNVSEKINQGIFIDVFPLDVYPDSVFFRKVQKNGFVIFWGALIHKCNRKLKYSSNPITNAIMWILSYLPKKLLLSLMERFQTLWKDKKSQYYIDMCCAYGYGKVIFRNEWLDGDLPSLKFNGVELSVPKDCEKSLKLTYGDYMKLPPLEKRVFRHSVSDIDFGDIVIEDL